ncbi:exonuclease SbcCD, C subunit [Actinomyces sp. oral taxon 848 str. F0332]|nr:exonuclease SbcCD, C subunit [Actinomyces sp. oral taxon 848 str. F0332]
MRLRRLTVSGIGPFADTFSIDFDALTAGGLFLLEGPTGSGKSTIIDAVVWALYGGVAGGRDSTDARMRSTHASPSRESFVDLVFSVEAGTFRVRRTPQWTKAGNKNPTNASAKLWRLSESAVEAQQFDAGEILEAKPAGTGAEIARLVGLSREQFLQTIVLPQGKFADFLTLDSTKRTALLEQVFDTSAYRRVAELLKERAAAAQSKVDSARGEWASSVEGLATALKLEGEAKAELAEAADAAGDPADAVRTAALAAAAVLRAEEESESAEEESALAAKRARERAVAAQEAADLASRLQKRSRLLACRDRLRAEEPEIDKLDESLAAHALAAGVASFLAAFDRAKAELGQAERRFALLDASDRSPHDVDAATLESQTALLETMTSLTGRLTELAAVEKELAASRRERTAAREVLRRAQEKVAAARAQASALPQAILRVEERLTAEEAEASRVESMELEAASLAKAAARFADLDRARSASKEANAAAAFEEARLLRDEQTLAWTASMSAIIAGGLSEGEACPVCGSTEHPAPAPPSNVKATREDVEDAEKGAAAARGLLAETEKRAVRAQAEVASAEADLKGLTRESVASALERTRSELASARRAQRKAAASQVELRDLRERSEAAGSSLSAAQSEQAAAEARIAGLDAAVERAQARIVPELAGYETISERLKAHVERANAQRRLVEAVRELLGARGQLDAREGELSAALSEAGFADATAARKAFMPREAAEAARTRVAEHRQASHDVARDLAAPEIAELTGDEAPDVEGTARLAEEAAETSRAAQRRAAVANERSLGARAQLGVVSEREEAWARLQSSAGPVLRLANLANAGSDSITKIPLATFVVRHRFEQILDRANERLADISLGRYQLARSDEKERGSREIITGLSVTVIDRDGEADGAAKRSPRSLSGGETFYVSLALALALADVVRAENGGIALETLLIDEGFGSLDEDTLGLVMSTLTGLARDGRAVGLVSHVAEMKKMIAERVTVRPLGDGSSRVEIRC